MANVQIGHLLGFHFPGSRTSFPGKREAQKSGYSQEFPVLGFPADSTIWDLLHFTNDLKTATFKS